MKSFWWFKEDSIAGMARPGFNSIRWFDLPFEEAVLLGWLGQHSKAPINLNSFRSHLQNYVPKIFKFHKLDETTGPKAIQIFSEPGGFEIVLKSLNSHIPLLQSFEIANNFLYFTMNEDLINKDIDFLKSHGIKSLITLTEYQHHKTQLQNHFATHHISIQDLTAPNLEQARELTEIIKKSLAEKESLVVHCMAGIGRTSTMLLAAHILLGENLQDLMALIAKQNPSFALSQSDFLKSISR